MASDQLKSLLLALEASPENVQLRKLVAQQAVKENEWLAVEGQAKVLLQIDPTDIEAKYLLAKAYFHNEAFSTAIIVLEELLDIRPDQLDYLQLYCQTLLKDGSTGQARDTYQRILLIDPNFKNEAFDAEFRVSSSPSNFEPIEQDFAERTLGMQRPSTNFSHVGGMEVVKKEIDLKIIKPFLHPELYKAYGKKAGGGILLYGPPGCGKTHIARATAGEVNANFLTIGINDILDAWLGNSERNLHQIFEIARKNAPCVLFIDEVDALGANRSEMKGSAGRNVINQFLSELDGVDVDNEGVLILAATNSPWHMDPAFKRPGRFDRMIFVSPPDQEARKSIFEIMLAEKPTGKIDMDKLAKKTPEFSGADIQSMIDISIEGKLELAFKTGVPQPIETSDLLNAGKKMVASTKEWFTKARNYAIYANDSGLYDDVLKYLKIKK
ncbi:ATP-binding protein [Roseivirga misakiensis]|uniref:Cell division protein n=1 Tax=Roseivirga misakiensis TaxID=1563681 RepID=A0A1E5SZV9_9BACT|nr:ATP-binding protein [Roseivirga misakiensis]OEK04660.1 cell division protein [Roseivirga misakiensis]